MSTFQLKNKSISAEPRLVFDLTSSNPGTLFYCLFHRTSDGDHHLINRHDAVFNCQNDARKFVVGKTATGILNARYPPSAAIVRIRKISGLGVARKPVRGLRLVQLAASVCATPFIFSFGLSGFRLFFWFSFNNFAVSGNP